MTVELDATSWMFTPGNRIRMAIAGADWPNAWPPPEAAELTVELRDAVLLPRIVGPPPVAERPNRRAGPGGSANGADATWIIERDVYGRRRRVTVWGHASEFSPTDGSRA